jgi:glycerophosphoryl diester phosphodiesterase
MKTIFIVCAVILSALSLTAEQVNIVAHRGASKDAPENTLPAFKLAWEQGADAIEGDFHLTKDGCIVCIHDDNTKKVSNENLVVRQVTLAELRRLDVGENHGKAFKGTVIPTLAEVFSTVPDKKKIYIEIKCGVEIITPLFKHIKVSELNKEQIVIISFNKEVIKAFKEIAPQYSAYWLCSFKKNRIGGVSPSLKSTLDTLKSIQADGLSSNYAIPESFVQVIEEQGFEWHVWTVDDSKTARRMKALGAKSITTNFPKLIAEQVNE